VAITDESVGVSQLFEDTCPGCLSKVYEYEFQSHFCSIRLAGHILSTLSQSTT